MNICIFCKSDSNTFNSVEHIFPESLGNKEKILPKGVVCDKCNNGVLAILDHELCNFDGILVQRTFNSITSKAGKVPDSLFNNASFKLNGNNNLNIEVDNFHKQITKTEHGFKVNWRGKKKLDGKQLRSLSRALYKIGLELVYLDHGFDFVMSSRFDEVRDIIMGKLKDFNGYLLMGGNSKTTITGMQYHGISIDGGEQFFIFEFNYMLLRIIFDMERRITRDEHNSKIGNLNLLKF